MLAAPICYLIPALFLLAVTPLGRRASTAGYVVSASAAAVVHIIAGGWYSTAVSALLAGAVFVLLVLTGLMSRATTFALPVALVGLPVLAWVALLPGLFAAGAVSAWRLRRAHGAGYLAMLAGETAAAAGVTNATGLSKPDLSRLPTPVTEAERRRMPLAFLLGCSVAAVGLVALLLG